MKITIRNLFSILLFLGLFILSLRPIADPDFWWHLRTGQLIIQARSIPHFDLYSFTRTGSEWITHEWLSEVLIFVLFRFGGYGSLILAFSLVITTSFLLVYQRCPNETRPYIAGFVLLLGAISTAPTWGVRPQMVSVFFGSIFLYLLDRYRKSLEIKFLIPLPLSMFLWVNLHAGFFLGLVILGIYLLGWSSEIALSKFSIGKAFEDKPPKRSIVALGLVLGICVFATLVNPHGVRILLYPFQTITSTSMQKYIQEWFSPDFHQIMWQPLAWYFLAMIGFGLTGSKTIKLTNIFLILIFGYASLWSARNIPFFIIASAPVLAEEIGSLVRIPSASIKTYVISRFGLSILTFCLIFVICACLAPVVHEQNKTISQKFPQAAVDWLLENKPKGNIFNSYGWGGYLIWRLYPEYKVFIDGRADVYGDEYISEYVSTYQTAPGWENKLDQWKIQTVLVESNSPLATILRQSPAWKISFENESQIILIR